MVKVLSLARRIATLQPTTSTLCHQRSIHTLLTRTLPSITSSSQSQHGSNSIRTNIFRLHHPASSSSQPVRHLNLHEYQSKKLMEKYNIRVQRGDVANSATKAKKIADELLKSGAKEVVLKAQVHAGGRGVYTEQTSAMLDSTALLLCSSNITIA
jgi:hypothetical protein